MSQQISQRLSDIVNALPLQEGQRVLEIGCGSGAAAREVAKRLGNGHVLAIDRSAKAISQAEALSGSEIRHKKLSYRHVAIEDFELEDGEQPFDLAFAVRVGALDGRHPEIEKAALTNIRKALSKKGRLFIDGGNPLREVCLR